MVAIMIPQIRFSDRPLKLRQPYRDLAAVCLVRNFRLAEEH